MSAQIIYGLCTVLCPFLILSR